MYRGRCQGVNNRDGPNPAHGELSNAAHPEPVAHPLILSLSKGYSATSVTVIVTVADAAPPLPSRASTVSVYDDVVS